MKNITIIGYSGHSLVVCDIFQSMKRKVDFYTELEEKKVNPNKLKYLGKESDLNIVSKLKTQDYFVSIGDNNLRKKVTQSLLKKLQKPINAIHPSAIISPAVKIGAGVMISAGVIINVETQIGDGVICNTGCIIEHECEIGNFVHIAPGAVLCGNVSVGESSFIGAGSVIKQGIKIGKNVIVGAGTVVVKNIANNKKVIGNPQREL